MNEKDQEKKLLVMLPRELHTRAKMQAVRTGQPLRAVVEQLLSEWTKQQEKKAQQGR